MVLATLTSLCFGLILCVQTVQTQERDASELKVSTSSDPPVMVVLGIAQDGGVPQAGTKQHPGWQDPDKHRFVVCLGLVDPLSQQRWMFEATPDFPEQLHRLDQIAPMQDSGLSGIFLTHAHLGHYTGLMFLGHEVMGAQGAPVYAMPRMRRYLQTNGPWDQLVRYENIRLQELTADSTIHLNERLQVTPFLAPHRQEYSEVVGYQIDGPNRSVLFIPDIDGWEQWDEWGTAIEDKIAEVDVAYLDATFFDNGEIPGRDMSGFPHPFIRHSMRRFSGLPASEKGKIRFIHLNHTNPALWRESAARQEIIENGFNVAEEMERLAL